MVKALFRAGLTTQSERRALYGTNINGLSPGSTQIPIFPLQEQCAAPEFVPN